MGSLTGSGVAENSPQGLAGGYTRPTGYEIDASSGEITHTGGPAVRGSRTLYVQVSDGRASSGGGASQAVDAEVMVRINIGNRAPSFNESGYAYTLEYSSDGTFGPVVGTPLATDLEGHTLTYSLRSSDSAEIMYMTGDTKKALYELDSTTGAAIGRVGTAVQFGAGIYHPHGMTWHDGQLYMVSNAPHYVYSLDNYVHTLDIATGEATPAILVPRGYNPTGLASHNGELYLTAHNDHAHRRAYLYRFDSDTWTWTRLGNGDFGVGESRTRGMASHGNPAELYMLGHDHLALYTLDAATGMATRVGSSNRFGARVYTPGGLASHAGNLYMSGFFYTPVESSSVLYTLDTTTGEVTRVGSSHDFGINEQDPYGLASGYRKPEGFTIDSATGEITYTGGQTEPGVRSLYVQVSDGIDPYGVTDTSVDEIVSVLVTVPNQVPVFSQDSYSFDMPPGTDGTGTDHTVGTVTATDHENDTVSYSLHSVNVTGSSEPVYIIGDDSDALHTVDIDTGTLTRIGTATGFGANVTEVRGLGWHNDELYLVGGTASEQDGIYTVDTTTGIATRVARMSDFNVGYRPLTAIASHAGTLYAVSAHNGIGRLFRIDLRTGRAAQIGSDDFSGANEHTPTGLTSHKDKLYMVGASTDKLYEIDPATGTATAVGSADMFSLPDSNEDTPGGLTSHGNVLYMTGTTTNSLYTLDTTTGTATNSGTLTGTNITENNPQGIASRTRVFTIDSSTGVISYTGSPAIAGIEYTLQAQATDGRHSSGIRNDNAIDTTTTVTVLVPNSKPSFGESEYSYTLTHGSDGTVTPVSVGTPTATDPDDHTLTYSARASDPAETMYMLGDGGDALYALDSTTGTAARVGTAEEFGVSETAPKGIGWHNGQLYMTGGSGLYTLDTLTGEAVRIATAEQLTGGGSDNGNGGDGGSGSGNTGGSGTGNNSMVSLGGVASHGGELYVTATGAAGRLYRVDPDALTGIQVGDDDFGSVGETSPVGIASHGSPAVLHMLGNDNNALYTVNTTTGMAARVGDADDFGVDETSPAGLASHDGSLRMTGTGDNALYTLDTATGEATRIGSVDDFGVGESSVKGVATGYRTPEDFTLGSTTGEITYTGGPAVPGVHILYAHVSDSANLSGIADTAVDDTARFTITVLNEAPVFTQDSYEFYMPLGIDGTDTAQPIGTVTAADPEGDTVSYSLRGSDTGPLDRLYMAGDSSDALYTVDPATGATARVGSADEFGAGVTAVRGLTRHDHEFYLIGGPASAQDGIYTVDTATGVATRVTRMSELGTGYRTLTAVTSHRGMLYAASSHGGTGRLFRINLRAGTATQISDDDFGIADENTPTGLASHHGRLYMVGASTDKLYEIDPVTGIAAAAGSAVGFNAPGGGEDSPSGLVSHAGELYMTGDSQDRLYTLDTTTGEATPTGSLTGSGVAENSPQGLASGYAQPPGYEINASTGEVSYTGGPAARDVHTLYVQVSDGRASSSNVASHTVDAEVTMTIDIADHVPSFSERSYSYTLTSGSDGSVTPVAVGAPPAADPEGHNLTYSLRASDPAETMYMVGTTKDALYALDSTTGAVTARIGTGTRFGVNETDPHGLTWHNGQLYMIGDSTKSLYTLDITTGAATRIVSDAPDTVKGIASHNGELYAVTIADIADDPTGCLYRVDLHTSAFVEISCNNFKVGEFEPGGIASHGTPAVLYMVGAAVDALYALDTTTGTAAKVGWSQDFGVYERNTSGLTSHAGNLYMIGKSGDVLYELNTTTGAATRIGSSHKFGVSEHDPSGLASGYRMPEGFTIGSATGDVAYTGGSAAPGVHVLYAQVSDGKNPFGAADAAVDDTSRVIVTTPDRMPVFSHDSYSFQITPGTDGTGTARPVGTVTATDPESGPVVHSLQSVTATGSAEPVYTVGDSSDALYTVDVATGAVARVGAATAFGANATEVSGLGWHNGELYLVGGTASEQDGIYTVDTATGVATRVARMSDLGTGYRPLTAVASHAGTLYAVSSHGGTGRLFRVDLQAGTAAQIGDDDFGSADESMPMGLASHHGRLYMVGASTDKLYEINADAGAAAAVGTADMFGTPGGGEDSPGGLTSHGAVLYMTGSSTNSLYMLDTVTGAATSVGALTGEGITENDPQGIASRTEVFTIDSSTGVISYTGSPAIERIEYTFDVQASDHQHYSGAGPDNAIDATATVTVLVAPPAPSFGESEYSYTLASGSDGTVTPVAVGTPAATGPEGRPLTYSARASDPAETMYMLGDGGDALYALDSTTGTAARVGTAGEFGVSETAPQGIGWHNGQLYMTGGSGLYTLDIATGEAVRVATAEQLVGSSGSNGGGGSGGSGKRKWRRRKWQRQRRQQWR